MRSYIGRRIERSEGTLGGVMVLVRSSEGNAQPLNPRLDLWNHSPTGFNWGYGGSGPAQLALAILADHLESHVDEVLLIADVCRMETEPVRGILKDRAATHLHQAFKWAVVARLSPYEPWELSEDDVSRTIAGLCAKRGQP